MASKNEKEKRDYRQKVIYANMAGPDLVLFYIRKKMASKRLLCNYYKRKTAIFLPIS